MKFPLDLTVGEWSPDMDLYSMEHEAVCFSDGQIVATTGPAGDQESFEYARLFSLSPLMLTMLRGIANGGDLYLFKQAWSEVEKELAKDRSDCYD